LDWITYLFGFEGRINRALQWQAVLVILCLMAFVALVAVLVASPVHKTLEFDLDDVFAFLDPRSWRLLRSTDQTTLIAKLLFTPVFLWMYLAVSIKRLHDRNRSGWWIIPFFLGPGLFDQFADLLPDRYWVVPFGLAIQGLSIWGAIELYCLRGTSGTNRFGADPLLKSEAAVAGPVPLWDQLSEIEFVPRAASPPDGTHVKRGA
jgi:uncharacterized membrane protein YhaH (DUF805 family)